MAAQTELKRGSAELMVLAAIEDRERHGYEIARHIDSRSNGVLRFHVGSLYPMLYRMERRGWIHGTWVEKAGQRRRRVTPGLKAFRKRAGNGADWLQAIRVRGRYEPSESPSPRA